MQLRALRHLIVADREADVTQPLGLPLFIQILFVVAIAPLGLPRIYGKPDLIKTLPERFESLTGWSCDGEKLSRDNRQQQRTLSVVRAKEVSNWLTANDSFDNLSRLRRAWRTSRGKRASQAQLELVKVSLSVPPCESKTFNNARNCRGQKGLSIVVTVKKLAERNIGRSSRSEHCQDYLFQESLLAC